MRKPFILTFAPLCLALMGTMGTAAGDDDSDPKNNNSCAGLPSYSDLKTALTQAVSAETSGLNLHMWGTIVDRDGVVCAVAFSGTGRGAQWPGSRVISAQKANTANAFSLDSSSNSNGSGKTTGLALSTANLYSAVQPGGSLFGLQFSNPVDPAVAYQGPSSHYGTSNDPLVGTKPGGVNVFGGGLALYAAGQKIIGAVGVSGDTSCADHNISWRVRNLLGLITCPAWAAFRATPLVRITLSSISPPIQPAGRASAPEGSAIRPVSTPRGHPRFPPSSRKRGAVPA